MTNRNMYRLLTVLAGPAALLTPSLARAQFNVGAGPQNTTATITLTINGAVVATSNGAMPQLVAKTGAIGGGQYWGALNQVASMTAGAWFQGFTAFQPVYALANPPANTTISLSATAHAEFPTLTAAQGGVAFGTNGTISYPFTVSFPAPNWTASTSATQTASVRAAAGGETPIATLDAGGDASSPPNGTFTFAISNPPPNWNTVLNPGDTLIIQQTLTFTGTSSNVAGGGGAGGGAAGGQNPIGGCIVSNACIDSTQTECADFSGAWNSSACGSLPAPAMPPWAMGLLAVVLGGFGFVGARSMRAGAFGGRVG